MKNRKALYALSVVLSLLLILTLCACISWPELDSDPTNPDQPQNGTDIEFPEGSGTPSNQFNGQLSSDDSTPSPSESANTVERIQNQVLELFLQTSSGITAGAGTIIHKENDNYVVLTCMHVVQGSEKSGSQLQVRTRDGISYRAIFLGGVPDNDIALISFSAQASYPVATIRDLTAETSRLRLGEEVYAIGNPLGTLGGSVSKGIISTISRTMTVENFRMNLIQVDITVNEGNSGGGLFDADGKLIGVVNAKTNPSAAEGIGFAIPILDAFPIAADILATTGKEQTNGYGYRIGKVYLGVSSRYSANQIEITDISDIYGSAYGYLSAGDVITLIDGSAPTSSDALRLALINKNPGDTLTLTVKRKTLSSSSTITVTIPLKQYVYGFRAA